MDYSQTVNLPETDFSMKANLSENEPERLRDWQENNLYERIQSNRQDAEVFVLHDGPPYANGDIHIGHALNKILKDILVKFKTMRGFRAPYRPGWDCHGLPIEHEVTSEQPETVEQGQVSVRRACREYALEYVDIQKDQFRRLGLLGEWDEPYLTLTPDYEASVLEAFRDLQQQDYIYRQLKPIHWCWDCETALAEAEVEYDEITSPAIYVDFEVLTDPNGVLESEEPNITIWTTTPWTIPANLAVAVHPDYTYVEFVDPEETVHLVAEPLLTAMITRRDWSTNDIEILQKISGSKLEGIGYANPLRKDRAGQVLLSDIVTLEQGSGCVHLAPGHGQEDYAIGQEHDLPVESPVSANGTFDQGYPPQEGIHVLTAQDRIVANLNESGHLFHSEDFSHSYPFCWRCGKPVIFRATPQWFLDVDHNNLRDRIMNELDDVEWIPDRGRNRFEAMIEDRPDWCLSRQRAWGVPIPAVECNQCSESILDDEIIDNVIEMTRNDGVSVWFDSDVSRFLPNGYVCPECGSEEFTAQDDILDVWFDSGVSHRAVLQNDEHLQFPADVYLEGSDQHRGWFQLSMIPSVALESEAPFKELVTHGFVVDEDGEKMSKSRGNVVSPQEIVDEDGADILRLWVASEDYHEDLVLGDELLDQVRDKYRRIRNTFKFLLGNLRDYNAINDGDPLEYEELSVLDRWFLTELYGLHGRVSRKYQDREFHQAMNEINNFCAVEASSLYIDISKDRLYCEPEDSRKHRSALTTLRHTLNVLTKLVAPVLSFTADEVWDYVPGPESVHETNWPDPPKNWSNDQLIDDFKILRNVRKRVMQAIEESEALNDSAAAHVEVTWPSHGSLLEEYAETLPDWMLVSEVDLTPDGNRKAVTVRKSDNEKCERCWRFRPSVRPRPERDQDLLCDRCHEAVEDIDSDQPPESGQ